MSYLLTQILLFLILAAVVGFFIGWVSRGFGFESRLISSENQWRAKHHVLQGENHRLQSEARHYKEQLKRCEELISNDVPPEQRREMATSIQHESKKSDLAEPTAIQKAIADSLDVEDLNNNQVATRSHPLDKLRSKLAEIESDDDSESIEQLVPGKPPAPLIRPLGDVDDLKKISGIGPKIENTLNDLGIFHFQQIAEFDNENIKWVNEHLNFKGRIEREKWVEQAKDIIKQA